MHQKANLGSKIRNLEIRFPACSHHHIFVFPRNIQVLRCLARHQRRGRLSADPRPFRSRSRLPTSHSLVVLVDSLLAEVRRPLHHLLRLVPPRMPLLQAAVSALGQNPRLAAVCLEALSRHNPLAYLVIHSRSNSSSRRQVCLAAPTNRHSKRPPQREVSLANLQQEAFLLEPPATLLRQEASAPRTPTQDCLAIPTHSDRRSHNSNKHNNHSNCSSSSHSRLHSTAMHTTKKNASTTCQRMQRS